MGGGGHAIFFIVKDSTLRNFLLYLHYNTNVNIEGGTVRKNVYGGANAAIVLGDANVLIGK